MSNLDGGIKEELKINGWSIDTNKQVRGRVDRRKQKVLNKLE